MAPDAEHEERLRAALWYAMGQFVDRECLRLNANATPQFVAAITELVKAQIGSVSKDLETFAKHAGRTSVTSDDVLLLARRNAGLEDLLRNFVDELRVSATNPKGKGKRARR